jgi:DNA-directed RNA polymerase subunit RPC12/RpoP
MNKENQLKIVCPFCNAPYTAEMVEELEDVGTKCETCGPTTEIEGTISIICSNCKKSVYVKEVKELYI